MGTTGVSEIPGRNHGKGRLGVSTEDVQHLQVNRGKEPGREIKGKSSEESGTSKILTEETSPTVHLYNADCITWGPRSRPWDLTSRRSSSLECWQWKPN